MSKFERFQGLGEKVRKGFSPQSPDQKGRAQQETEIKRSVIVQYVYYPQDSFYKLAAVKDVEQAAKDFFSEEEGVKNIFAIEAPPLPGLNIPHFYEEFKNVGGKYLEGYFQHNQTGFLKKRPFTEDELKQIREQVEEAVTINPYGQDDDERHQLHFIQSLLMFDRLAESRRFQLVIQPLTAKDVISLFGNAKRLLKKLETSRGKRVDEKLDKKIQTEQDLDSLLEELRSLDREELHAGIELEKKQQASFDRFVDDVINKSLGNRETTRIFIPREESSFYFDNQRFSQETKQKNPKVTYLAPLFLGEKNTVGEQIALKGKPDDLLAEVTQEEALYGLVLNILHDTLAPFALDPVVDRLKDEFKKNATPEEVRRALIPILQDDTEESEERIIQLMNFFGEKTNGVAYGEMIKMMSNGGLKGLIEGSLQGSKIFVTKQKEETEPPASDSREKTIEEELNRVGKYVSGETLEVIRRELEKMGKPDQEKTSPS